MRIASVEIPGRTVLAPLAGITDLPFRLICKEMGAALVYTEMISAEGLVRAKKAKLDILDSDPSERPVAFQLFGSNPESMAGAAALISPRADIIDINMGCPVRKVVKGGSGAALLKDLGRAKLIIEAVVGASSVPVSIKIRTGWGADYNVSVELARIAEAAGVKAVAVHGRYALQGFSGRADWRSIRAVKEAVGIPVMGNGDVASAEDAVRMTEETGCDLVMIGRGALGNPWIFREAEAYFAGGEVPGPPSAKTRGATLLRHLAAVVARYGEEAGVRMMRKHAAWYSKGLKGSPAFRAEINHAAGMAAFEDAAGRFFGVSGEFREGARG